MFINLGSGFIVFIGASTSDFQFGKILSYSFQAPQCWLRDDDKCKKLFKKGKSCSDPGEQIPVNLPRALRHIDTERFT